MDVRERAARLIGNEGLPPRDRLPIFVAPLPAWLENLGLRLAWPIVIVNLVGTVFGFWYYGFHPVPLSDPLFVGQFGNEPLVMWPFVPDSPLATLFIAAAFAAWKLERPNEYLNALALFGCLKLGLWTPFVLVVFKPEFSYLHPAMYNFLFWSHLAMVVEAFVLYRFADFPVRAVTLAMTWYGFNDFVDYFVPIVGDPHHTYVPAEVTVTGIDHGVTSPTFFGADPHATMAGGAVVLTLVATWLAFTTRISKLQRGHLETDSQTPQLSE